MLSSHSFCHPALLLLLTSRACSEEKVRPGEVITLTCPVPAAPWFFCVWESPRAQRVCELRHQLGGPGLCGGEARLTITGNLTVCQLNIAGVEVGDHGSWTCAVSDSASLETVKQSQSLLVAVVGQLSLSPVLPSVQLGEGDLAQLVCRVTTAWPRPAITWSVDSPASLHSLGEVVVESDPTSHLVSVSQSVRVRAGPQYRGNVSCRARQGDLSQERRLTVVPLTARLTSSRGLLTLSLVTTSCLLVILAAALVLLGIRKTEVKVESEAGTQPAISYIDLHHDLHHDLQHDLQHDLTNNLHHQLSEEETKPYRPAVSPPPAYRASPACSLFHCQHSCFSHQVNLQQP